MTERGGMFGARNVPKTYTAPRRGRRGCVHLQGDICMMQRLSRMGLGGVEPPTSRLSGDEHEIVACAIVFTDTASGPNACTRTHTEPARNAHERVHNAYTRARRGRPISGRSDGPDRGPGPRRGGRGRRVTDAHACSVVGVQQARDRKAVRHAA